MDACTFARPVVAHESARPSPLGPGLTERARSINNNLFVVLFVVADVSHNIKTIVLLWCKYFKRR